jgi:hypothetical protein
MLDPTLTAAAVVTVLAAIGGTVVQIINSWSAARDRREAAAERKALLDKTTAAVEASKDNSRKADELIKSTTEIHTLTNSTNSNLQKALELMTEKNAGLEKLMAQMQDEKKTTAAQHALTDVRISAVLAAPSAGPVPASAGKTLRSIESNTAAIDTNTKHTSATIDALADPTKT